MQIKVGYCVAYDWELLKHSLPLVYKHADIICLSYDVNNNVWAGEKFDFDKKAFLLFADSIDKQKKIRLLEDDFCLPTLSPMQNEVRQRNCIAQFMGQSGWHIQLDCDEYFPDFGDFCQYLGDFPPAKATNINCIWLTLFKRVKNGFLIIDAQESKDIETIPIATAHPHYEYGRRNGHFNHQTNFVLLHQSWARSEDEIRQKISSWGHKNDFNGSAFVKFWLSVNEENYGQFKNFHPIIPTQWPALRFVETSDIETCVSTISAIDYSRFSQWDLMKKNSRVYSKIKSLLS